MIYDKPKKYWNEVFSKEEVRLPANPQIPIKELEQGMNWLIQAGDSILDFGCGNGTLLIYADLKGAKYLHGIDISESGIELGKKRAEKMPGQYQFIHGDVKALRELKSESFDGVILSNIIDNLTEDDMAIVLEEIHRILKKNGRLLIKMNDYIQEKDYDQFDIKVINQDLLDDGLLLLNKRTDTWRKIFRQWFNIEDELIVYFEKFDAKNRMFLLKK